MNGQYFRNNHKVNYQEMTFIRHLFRLGRDRDKDIMLIKNP